MIEAGIANPKQLQALMLILKPSLISSASGRLQPGFRAFLRSHLERYVYREKVSNCLSLRFLLRVGEGGAARLRPSQQDSFSNGRRSVSDAKLSTDFQRGSVSFDLAESVDDMPFSDLRFLNLDFLSRGARF